MVHTSDTIQGQVFVPVVNWILMIATIIIVAAFKSSVNLTNAYGFAVATVMISTSTLIAVQMRYVKGLPIIVALAFFVFYGFIDGLFWGASLRKVPQGAWVPLMLGGLMMILMLFWTWAKGLEDQFDGANRKNLRHFIVTEDGEKRALPPIEVQPPNGVDVEVDTLGEETYYYLERLGSDAEEEKQELVRIDTCAVFHKVASGKGVPHSFVGFIRQWPALPRVVVFLSVSILPIPVVPAESRYVVDKVRSVKGVYAVTYYIGFREGFEVKIDDVVQRICSLESRADPRESSETINEIKRAALRTTHIVPYYHVSSKWSGATGVFSYVLNWLRKFLIEGIYLRLATMFPGTVNWTGSGDEIIRVGINATI